MRADPQVGIIGTGTALPPFAMGQMELLSVVHPRLERGSARQRLAQRLFRNSCIRERRSCIPDFSHPEAAVLYRDGAAGNEQRMRVFQREAPRLAAAACERAMKRARTGPEAITHLVVVTSTGAGTPGRATRSWWAPTKVL